MPFLFTPDGNEANVEIKKSKLPRAGNGLFAKKNFKKGDFICAYMGVLLEKDMVDYDY